MAVQIQEQQRYNELPVDSIIHGDALEVLKTLPDNCIDAIVCDPPAGISFMNKEFDHNKGGRTQWVAWLAEIMREAKRCLRPGGHCLVWSLPRTSHWTALALEDAGFEIRDNIYNIVSGDTALHTFVASLNEEQQQAFMQIIDGQREPSGILDIFGSGFPKSHNISIAIDKYLKAERGIIGSYDPRSRFDGHTRTSNGTSGGVIYSKKDYGEVPITIPATPQSTAYDGFGSALKPSVENWWLVRKPLAASSIAENVLEYGVGALNIDGCRVGWETGGMAGQERTSDRISPNPMDWGEQKVIPRDYKPTPQGRFPSHLLLSHTLFCVQSGTKKVNANDKAHTRHNGTGNMGYNGNTAPFHTEGYADEDGMETVTAWICDENCPVRLLDLQGGQRPSSGRHGDSGSGNPAGLFGMGSKRQQTYFDSGGPSRYFQQLPAIDEVPPYIYAGKASRKDRDSGLEELPGKQGFDKNTSKTIAHINHATGETTYNEYHPSSNKNTHPCVKSQQLMRYLVRLVTPPNGIVLDMFSGSGSTLVAAIHEGFNFIGIEKELEYITIARSRIAHAIKEVQR